MIKAIEITDTQRAIIHCSVIINDADEIKALLKHNLDTIKLNRSRLNAKLEELKHSLMELELICAEI